MKEKNKMAMLEKKIDKIIDDLGAVRSDIGTLKSDVGSLKDGQRKNGLLLEQVQSDVKAVAEGHGGLLNRIDSVHDSLKNEIKFTGCALKEGLDRVEDKLKEHVRVSQGV